MNPFERYFASGGSIDMIPPGVHGEHHCAQCGEPYPSQGMLDRLSPIRGRKSRCPQCLLALERRLGRKASWESHHG